MFARSTSLAATTLRRVLSVAMGVLMLLSVLALTEAVASTSPASVGQAELVLSGGGSGDAPVQPESLPCHAAHHFCGKVTPVPPTIAAAAPVVAHPESKPEWAPARILVSGLTELPPRPPRA